MSQTLENNKRIARNTLMLYFRMFFIMAVTLYTSRVVLKTLGVEDYGIYNVVGGIVAMMGILNGAMSVSTQRYLTFELGKGDMVRFFSKQLDDLVNGKGQLLDIKRIFNLSINHIYNHNINDTQYAILYIMEDVFRKYKQSKQHRELLMNIHAALRYNLKLVLSLAADTKERIDRVETLISTRTYSADGYIRIGEEDKAKAYITNWYQSLGYNTLTIIDPYFKPEDLAIVKPLCDINNDLEIRILTHRQKFSNEDYQSSWKSISSVVTNHINLNFVWYKDSSKDGPLHDRFWICSDEENDEHCGITLCSVDSLGKKESSINPIEKAVILTALNSYTKYVYRCIGKAGGRELMYDKLNLSL